LFGSGGASKLPAGALSQYPHRTVEFHYTALGLHAPQRLSFRYRLEGVDKDWVRAGQRCVAYYTNLSPGAYRFLVEASDLKAHLQELQDTRERLVHSEKMAAIGTLAAGVGHEINNPLAFIISNLRFVSGEIRAAVARQAAASGPGALASLPGAWPRGGDEFVLVPVMDGHEVLERVPCKSGQLRRRREVVLKEAFPASVCFRDPASSQVLLDLFDARQQYLDDVSLHPAGQLFEPQDVNRCAALFGEAQRRPDPVAPVEALVPGRPCNMVERVCTPRWIEQERLLSGDINDGSG